jgi:hypothetical protein
MGHLRRTPSRSSASTCVAQECYSSACSAVITSRRSNRVSGRLQRRGERADGIGLARLLFDAGSATLRGETDGVAARPVAAEQLRDGEREAGGRPHPLRCRGQAQRSASDLPASRRRGPRRGGSGDRPRADLNEPASTLRTTIPSQEHTKTAHDGEGRQGFASAGRSKVRDRLHGLKAASVRTRLCPPFGAVLSIDRTWRRAQASGAERPNGERRSRASPLSSAMRAEPGVAGCVRGNSGAP